MYPVSLQLAGRTCLVVGGGPVAWRKTASLLEAGARITLVAPDVVAQIAELAERGTITFERRLYRPGEAAGGYAVVFAATDRREVNRQVFEDAKAANVFVNVADDPELCNMYLLARVRRGPLELAIGSGGGAPFLSGRLRRVFEDRLGHEWGPWADAAVAFRSAARARGLSTADQEACYDRFVERTLDPQQLTVREPAQAEWQAWLDEAGQASAVPPPDRKPGLVSLVGAGPGCAGLLTVRGLDRLRAADAVVFDRLALGALPPSLDDRVLLVDVGKTSGHHPVPQGEINAMLIRLAREGKRVVRLKGGDPFVFGRGAEEAEALRDAGVPFEVIPGVTSGLAAPALAGIPVTSRQEAVQVTLLTAHESEKPDGPQIRWDLLAGQPHATIVGYMGVAAVRTVARRLMEAGMSADTPAAMIEQGATSSQRSVVTTIAALPESVECAGLNPPALFVVGPTVTHASALNWVASQPLFGERLAVSRASARVTAALEGAGAEIVFVPVPLTHASRLVLGARPVTGCVVSTATDVECFDEVCHGPGWDATWTAWCLDAEAARRARACGWPRVELVAGLAEPWDALAEQARLRRGRADPR
jgi:uroporphyrin-III C-methyltransferase/precorrin-2 dehydrogenase/sirohydrochlorin ferrochelatase